VRRAEKSFSEAKILDYLVAVPYLIEVALGSAQIITGVSVEQAHISAQHPSSCEDPRLPCTHAHSRRSRDSCSPSPQGPCRAQRLEQLLLARENRLISPLDFRDLSRSKNRRVEQAFILNWRKTDNQYCRFGFVVSRAVGSAVARNLAKRRLRAVSRSWLASVGPVGGFDFVFRAKPEILGLEFDDLRARCLKALDEAVR
jgi:ribonuclease P protein component